MTPLSLKTAFVGKLTYIHVCGYKIAHSKLSKFKYCSVTFTYLSIGSVLLTQQPTAVSWVASLGFLLYTTLLIYEVPRLAYVCTTKTAEAQLCIYHLLEIGDEFL